MFTMNYKNLKKMALVDLLKSDDYEYLTACYGINKPKKIVNRCVFNEIQKRNIVHTPSST